MINRTMTLDAGKSLRSVIVTEKDEWLYKITHTLHAVSFLSVTTESLISQIFLLPLFNEIG